MNLLSLFGAHIFLSSVHSWDLKSQLDRRKVLSHAWMTGSLVAAIPLTPASAIAAWDHDATTMLLALESRDSSSDLPIGLLETRVTENVQSPPPYGMEASDITYPSWFAGTWQVASTTTDILAPCGIALFGGNATYQKARAEIGTTLEYTSRFVPVLAASCNDEDTLDATISTSPSSSTCTNAPSYTIADREYNVQSLAKAALGVNSIVNIGLATPNKFSCILAPNGSPNLLSVDMLTLNRRQEIISDTRFDCSEVVREIVGTLDSDGRPLSRQPNAPMPLLKEIETTSLYTYFPEKNQVTCRQRSAAFLLPSQTDPLALKLWEAARGRPVDVRYYDVVYKKV